MRSLIYRTLSRIKCHTGCRGHCTLTDEPISVCMQGPGQEEKSMASRGARTIPGELLKV